MKKGLLCFALGSALFLSACGASKSESSYDAVSIDTSEVSIEVSSEEYEVNSEINSSGETVGDSQLNASGTVSVELDLNAEKDSSEQVYKRILGDFDNTRDAYLAFLRYMIDNSVEVDGMDGFCESYAETIADNQFAILDVDGDGDDELIIDWTNPTAMVGYTSYIFKYDVSTGEWSDELEGGGALTVFDNGIIYADAAHNQGYGFLWPYTILKYNAARDSFESIGSVDSEDKELVIDSQGDESFYHEEYDPTGCGTVYMLSASNLGYEWGYYTQEQFEEFNKKLVGGANIIAIDYLYINKENVDAISVLQ